jgi:ubiquitin-activating enzyme E1 C
MSEISDQHRWKDIDLLLSRTGSFSSEYFQPDGPDSSDNRSFLLEDCRVCVIGAGGLGCELLKDLTLMGFRNIDVIDMDEIDYSNLNRQFLFRIDDVGKPKALVAAAFVNRRVPGAKVTGHYAKIQDMEPDFWSGFNLIIAGLDNIGARRWINCTLVNLVEEENPASVIPLIDGGTEGWKGQSRVILPGTTPCFECLLDLFPDDPLNFPICTIANTPRQPEHCIQFPFLFTWETERKGEKVDGDNAEHIQWIFERALLRAQEFGIEGVTFKLTQGVVKHIIPAIASTNAIISASCATEAFKLASNTGGPLKNYMMYSGSEGLYTSTINYDRDVNCIVCGSARRDIEVPSSITVKDFITELSENESIQLPKASITTIRDDKNISMYMQAPPMLEKQTSVNLDKLLIDFVPNEGFVTATDSTLPGAGVQIKVTYKSE